MTLHLFCLATFSLGQFNNFFEEFMCEEKAILSTVSIGTPCAECGSVPYPTRFPGVSPTIDSPEVWSFVSAPNLHPMKIQVNLFNPGTSTGPIFLAPYVFSSDSIYGQQGALILDNAGNPIWFRPTGSVNLMNTDFRTQTLNGQPVLTFWQGTLITPPAYNNGPGGSSEPASCYYILDNTYRTIGHVTAHNGFISDIHEFLLTPQNTALFLSTKQIPMDLSPYGGPKNGYVQDFAIQEVDIATNKLLFFWDALEHIPFSASFQPASSAVESGNVWDVYHLNSIGITDVESDIVLSGRNLWTIYRIHKPTGAIVWQLGGKASSFTIESGAEFSWQHDARYFPGNVVTLFDDNCCESDTIPPGTPYAHGLQLQLDLNTLTATLVQAYFHTPNINVASQGNVQTLPNTNKFIGWGQSQYYSEFLNDGTMVYDAQMPSDNVTYRAYRNDWTATPYYPPSIALVGATVYASWNGSTETASWNVYAGPTADSLSLSAISPKTGFETAIPVGNPGPFYQVQALNSLSQVIGTSPIIER